MNFRFFLVLTAFVLFGLYVLNDSSGMAQCEQQHSRSTCLENLSR